MCEWRGCRELALEVDHVKNLAEHREISPYDETNLQSLCEHHHAVKTGHEAQAAIAAKIERGPFRGRGN